MVILEVTGQYNDSTPVEKTINVRQGFANISTISLRLCSQQFTNYSEHVFSSFFRRDNLFNLIRKENKTYFVPIFNSTKGQDSAELNRKLPFALILAAKNSALGDINTEHKRLFALLLKFLNIWISGTSGNIPVNLANIVSVGIFTNF